MEHVRSYIGTSSLLYAEELEESNLDKNKKSKMLADFIEHQIDSIEFISKINVFSYYLNRYGHFKFTYQFETPFGKSDFITNSLGKVIDV